jgi:nucleoside-diphosphate-sugar epimerase
MKKILITGGAGNIGQKAAAHLSANYALTLIDRRECEGVVEADLSQWGVWSETFEGIDTVVHLAANPHPGASWAELLEPNIDTVMNVYEASARAGVRRLVFASSNHAMGGYMDRLEPGKLTTELTPLPGTPQEKDGISDAPGYGTTKLIGERLGKWYSEMHGLSFIALRIGWVRREENLASDLPTDQGGWLPEMWLSNRDLCQIIEKCIEAPDSVRFAVLNAMSANNGMAWDIEHTQRVIGYQPMDGRGSDAC